MIYRDEVWGEFALTGCGRQHTYEGQALWNGHPVELVLEMGKDLSPSAALRVARELWRDEAGWKEKVDEAAVAELLRMQQEEWPLEDEVPLTEAQLRERLKVTNVTAWSNGGFTFWHAGDIFHGHDVEVYGTLSEGIKDVGVHG